jgi:hypothetical protein
MRAVARGRKAAPRRAGEGFDGANLPPDGGSRIEMRAVRRKRHMGEHVLEVLGESKRVGGRGKQRQNYVEDIFRRDRSAIGVAQSAAG